jgi:hypothetical protein
MRKITILIYLISILGYSETTIKNYSLKAAMCDYLSANPVDELFNNSEQFAIPNWVDSNIFNSAASFFWGVIAKNGDKIKEKVTGWGVERKMWIGNPLTIYVSTNGDDTNDGLTQDTPIRSIAKLKTIYQDGCVVLFSRGETWRNKVIDNNGTLIIDSDNLLLEDMMGGNAMYFDLEGSFTIKYNPDTTGNQPIFDASVEIPKNFFTIDSGTVYKFLIETRHRNPNIKVSADTARPWLFENGKRLEYKKTITEVNANSGTFTYVKITDADISNNNWGTVEVYVHTNNSDSPITNGKVYDYTMYSMCLNKNDNLCEITTEYITLQRACGKDANHLHGGYANNVVFKQNSSHNQLKHDLLMENSISIDAIGDCYHAHDGGTSINEGMTYRNCVAEGSEVFDSFYSNINGTNRTFAKAFYTHGGAGQKLISVIDCETNNTSGVYFLDVFTTKVLRILQTNYSKFASVMFYNNPKVYKELHIVDSKGFLKPDFVIGSADRYIEFDGDGELYMKNVGLVGGYMYFPNSSILTNMLLQNATIYKLHDKDNFNLYNSTGFGQATFKNSIIYLKQTINDGPSIPTVISDEGLTMSAPIFENCYLHNQFVHYNGVYYTAEEYALAYPSFVIGELKSNFRKYTDKVLGQTVYKDYKGFDGPTDRALDSGTGIDADGNQYNWEYDGRIIYYYFDIEINFMNSMKTGVVNHPTFKWVNSDNNKRYSTEDRYNGIYTREVNGVIYHNGYGNAIVDDATGFSTGDGNTAGVSSGFTSDGKIYLAFDLNSQQINLPKTPIDLKIDFLQLLEDNVFQGEVRLGNFEINPNSIAGEMEIGFDENDTSLSENEDTMGVEENEDNNLSFSIFPNPTGSYLFIGENENSVNVSIYSLSGEKVISTENTNKIDVKNLPSGVYIISISDELGQTNKKFIKF